MQILVNTHTESMHEMIYQLTQKNVRLQSQVADLTREVGSTVVAKITPTLNDNTPKGNHSGSWMTNTKTIGTGNHGPEPRDSTTNHPLSIQTSPNTEPTTSKSDPSFSTTHSEHGDNSGSRNVGPTGTDMAHGQQIDTHNHSWTRISTGKNSGSSVSMTR